MTDKEAINYLKSFELCKPYTMDAQGVYKTAVDTVIKALEQHALRENDEKLKKIILAKCDEREREGYDSLTDSDIMDIIEECERRGIEVTREKLKEFGID